MVDFTALSTDSAQIHLLLSEVVMILNSSLSQYLWDKK